MNRIHRTVWNPRRGAYMVAAENTRSQGKASGAGGALLAGVLMGAVGVAHAAGPTATALPTGAQVTAGQAQIGTVGKTMTVMQGSEKAAINWGSFSIGKDATVQFVQPDASAIALNRVTGSEGSLIDGALSANGQVFILNPNGVLFGKNARVDTAGLVATTLGLSDADFLAGRNSFAGHGGAVVNQGSLTAKDGGYIALIGQQVKNDGTLTARLGTVALAAGDKVSLNFNGDSLVGVAIDRGALDALVANGGAIRADGGLVVLTAKGAEGLVDTLVNNTGEVRAQTVENKAGRIYLLGEGGKVEVAGTLDASAPRAGDGGFVETSGSKVHVDDSTKVTTLARHGASGNWLIDPTDFTVAESGGDITGAALSSNLATGSVTIQSTSGAHGYNGDIVVSDPVTWGANTTLTLEAQNNIYVFSDITATGASGKLALYYGLGALASGNTSNYFVNGAQVNLQAGQNFDTKQGSDGAVTNWTVITALGAAGSVTGTDLQGINGNQSGNFALGADIAAGATTGWNAGAGFDPLTLSGNFDGLGHKIDGLFINKSSNFAGLFGSLYGTARNVGVTNADVTGGGYYTGALAGYSSGLVEASYSTGSVTGDNATGGLVGYNDGTVKTSFSGVHVTGGANVGGLVGNNWGYVLDTYATGTVYGLESVGGLIGNGYYSQEVSRSYAVGAVTADVNASYVGGLVAPSNQPIPGSGNFWDVATTGQVVSGAGTGLTTAPMTTTSTFTGAGWNFMLGSGVWARRDDLNNMYPVLRIFGYTDRIGVATLAPAYFADPAAGLSYTTSGLLTGDTITLAQSGSTLAFTFNNPARTGLYDALQVRSQAPTGDLTVNRPITWSNFQLVLEAAGDINVNAVMSATGTSSLDLKTGYNFNPLHPVFDATRSLNMGMDAGHLFTGRIDIDRTGSGILTINNQGYTLVNSLGQAGDESAPGTATLQGIADPSNLAGNFALASNIDASDTANSANWGSSGSSAIDSGFRPIGGFNSRYTGVIDGLGHTVDGLNQVQTSGNLASCAGLVCATDGAVIRNLALTDVNFSGQHVFGAVVGDMRNSTLANLYVTGSVSGDDNIGGVFANSNNYYPLPSAVTSFVRNVHFSGTVTATGGNVGGIGYGTEFTDVTGSSSSGTVSGANLVGGLFGAFSDGTLTSSQSSATVMSTGSTVGGLVGDFESSTLADSSASGAVTGQSNVGGLLGYVYAGTISHSQASGSSVSGSSYVGGLVGMVDSSSPPTSIDHSTSTVGTVTASNDTVGGLVGSAADALLDSVSASSNVSGSTNVGGLVGTSSGGHIVGGLATGTATATATGMPVYVGGLVGYNESAIESSQASGNVSGWGFVGGLVGYNTSAGSISSSQASGAASGFNWIAGLVGVNEGSIVTSFATGSASGSNYVGGLVGVNHNGSISDTYARGDATGSVLYAGGLVGVNNGGTITRSYSTGAVSASMDVGGLVGFQFGGGTATHSFYDATVNPAGALNNGIGTGQSTAVMTTTSTFTTAGWDFTFRTGVWGRKDSTNNAYPVLRTFGYTDPLTLTLAGATKTYGDANPSLGSYTVTGCPTANCLSAVGLGSAIDLTTGVGSYAYSAANVLSLTFAGSYNASQFDITLPSTSLTIAPRPVSLATASGATRVYDRTTDAASTLFSLGNLVNGDTVSLSGAATLASAHAGVEAVTGAGTLTLSNGNYTLVNVVPTGSVIVSPRAVSVATASGATRVYDATTDAAASLLQVGGVLNGDSVNLAGTATLAGTNVGAQAVGLGTLALDNADYTLASVVPTGTVAITPRAVSLATASGATRVYDRTTDAASTLFTLGNLAGNDSVSLSGTATLASAHAGVEAVTGAGTLTLSNGNYTLGNVVPTGSVIVSPRAVSVATASGATRVYDATTDAAASLLQVGGVLPGDTVNLAGTATLASKNVGAQGVGTGSLALDNANYTLVGVVPTGTVSILPRTLNLSFTVATKTFDGSTAANATASDNRLSGDQLTAQFSAAYADTNAGTAKPVAITGLALSGADAGNYQLASTAGSGVTGNMLTRSVTYTLAAQDPSRTYTATGQVLVSASALDQLVVATFANTVAGTSPGALSYTIYKNGQQVDAITDAGAYEIRASFAAADPHYALASTGNSAMTIVVAAATAVTPPSTTVTTPPATGTTAPTSTTVGPVAEVIAEAVRTDVPVSAAAVYANAGVAAPRSLVDFSAMPPNVATSPAALTAAFGEGVPLSLLSSPSGAEPSQAVTLAQASQMVTPSGGANANRPDLRVPVSRNSLAQIVNGGVKLPGGVDQLLFVVKADK